MAHPAARLYDLDAANDPFLADYERARDTLRGPDWREGLAELERLAYGGSILSMLLVSDAMLHGWMYDQDLPGAEAWYRVAADSNSARGLCGLGLTYLQMDRFSDAISNLEGAIARGYPPAYNALAGVYFRGDGVAADRQRALTLWREGAALGHLMSKRNLVQQQVSGRYGFRNRWVGWLCLLPVAFETAIAKAENPYTDRLR
jgi:TPR repeat protein